MSSATGSRGSAAAREQGFETYFLAEAKSEDRFAWSEWKTGGPLRNRRLRSEGRPASFIINDMAQNLSISRESRTTLLRRFNKD